MAEAKKGAKSRTAPAENKAATAEAEPKLATTAAGEEAAASAEEPTLKKADESRYEKLAQSGYRIPKAWAAEEAERIAHDKAIAKNMPSTHAQEHKP